MAGLYDDEHLKMMEEAVASLAPRWGLSEGAVVSLLNISENATYLARDNGHQIVLRVHRPGYHTLQEIESELDWIAALRSEAIVSTPEPLTTTEGRHIASFELDGAPRQVVGFAYMTGTEPSPEEDLTDGFRDLGAISARLHDHAQTWPRPAGFVRKTWDFDTTVGPRPHWGDWRAALGLTDDGRAVLERLCDALRRDLAAIGTGKDEFGLIHADLRLANLLVEGDRLGVIDFDDCGFGWWLYDFAAAISFYETDPQIPALEAAWVEGYRSVAPLPEDKVAQMPTFIMLRRLLLTAWIASHAETPTAQEFGTGYTDGTVAMADRYLSRG